MLETLTWDCCMCCNHVNGRVDIDIKSSNMAQNEIRSRQLTNVPQKVKIPRPGLHFRPSASNFGIQFWEIGKFEIKKLCPRTCNFGSQKLCRFPKSDSKFGSVNTAFLRINHFNQEKINRTLKQKGLMSRNRKYFVQSIIFLLVKQFFTNDFF